MKPPVPIDMQVLLDEIGRIRLGYSEPVPGKTTRTGQPVRRPRKLDTFRLTSQSRNLIEQAAGKYGGDVTEWQNQGHREWSVITDADDLMVSLPNTPGAIDADYEWWAGGECLHRCDGRFDRKAGQPCRCPSDPVERHFQSKLNPPQACGLKLRVQMILPDLLDVGTWRLDSAGFYAAGRMMSKVAILQAIREQAGLMIPARLWLSHESDVKNGQVRRWVTPKLELQRTLRQLASLEASAPIASLLPPPPGTPLAIAAPSGAPAEDPWPEREPDADPRVTAQDYADAILSATTRTQVHRISAEVKKARMADDVVYGPPEGDPDAAHVETPLRDLGTRHWESLPEGT